ncbi:MAG: hypothetical protein ACRD2N_23955 [Vicinamibacterales bacterium]
MAVPFDARMLQQRGSPTPVPANLRRSTLGTSGAAHFSVFNNGSLVYLPGLASGLAGTSDLGLTDRTGNVQRLNLPPGSYLTPRTSLVT